MSEKAKDTSEERKTDRQNTQEKQPNTERKNT